MLVSRFTKIATLIGSAVVMSQTAAANCAGTYCNNSSASLAPLSSWSQGPAVGASVTLPGTHSPVAAYGSSSSYSTYSSGSSYSSGGQSYVPFSSNTSVANMTNLSISGLGANERLCEANCPVDVHNPMGGQVLGCYKICQPVAPRPVIYQNFVRVVRPIIYVRYPVPVAVPGCTRTVITHYSRYGLPNYGCGR